MDANHFDSLVRALVTTPSRRAVNRALAGVAAASVLAPLISLASVEAKKKKGRKKKQKKKKTNEQICKALGYVYCPGVGAPKDCCYQDPEFGIDAICTECGCCSSGFPNCCLGGIERACCANDETCCLGPNGEASCCEPGAICCQGGCCAPFANKCCAVEGCCHELKQCCPDGSCRFVCP